MCLDFRLNSKYCAGYLGFLDNCNNKINMNKLNFYTPLSAEFNWAFPSQFRFHTSE